MNREANIGTILKMANNMDLFLLLLYQCAGGVRSICVAFLGQVVTEGTISVDLKKNTKETEPLVVLSEEEGIAKGVQHMYCICNQGGRPKGHCRCR
jgi:hypothetical protein